MNKNIMNAIGFKKEVKLVKQGKCPLCKISVNPNKFKDQITLREYKISGLCQKCQDEIFV